MKKFIKNKNVYSVILSVVLSFAFVAVSVFASSTISTNISTDGTLTVSGASTMNGDVTLGDVATDVILSTGTLHASSTLLVTGVTTLYGTTTIKTQPLVLGLMATNPGGQTEGSIFYDSVNKTIKLYDGSNWFTVGTTTSGLTLSGSRIQISDLTTQFLTFGTTTPQGASVLTLEATSTVAIPLTIVARDVQTANTFQIRNSASSNLFYINSGGNLFATGTVQITGVLTTYGSDTFGDAQGDTHTINAGTVVMGNSATVTVPTTAVNNIWSIATSTTGTPIFSVSGVSSAKGRIGIGTVAPATTLEVIGTASSTSLIVGGDSTSGTVAGLIFGTCSLANTTVAASTTVLANCTSATGVTTNFKVFVQASTLYRDFIIQAASSTALNTIGLAVFNTGRTGTTTTSIESVNTTLNFIGIR